MIDCPIASNLNEVLHFISIYNALNVCTPLSNAPI